MAIQPLSGDADSPFDANQTLAVHRQVPRPASGDAASAALFLVPIAGPARDPLPLQPDATAASGDGLLLGRHEQCTLRLDGAEQISRRHARFRFDHGRWFASDVGSSWGTSVNGQKLTAGDWVEIAAGDQVRMTPWTFLVSTSSSPRGMHVTGEGDATSAGSMRQIRPSQGAPLAQERLAVLLDSASTLQQAPDEKTLARRLLDMAQQGTSLANGAVLQPVDGEGRYNVLASNMTGGAGATFSRSLLDLARQGEVAELHRDSDADVPVSQSIVQMEIRHAVCVPIKLGDAASLFLYLDHRQQSLAGAGPRVDHEGETAYCLALGRIASLALSNLKRVEMERRAAEYEADLKAAAAAQQWILPPRTVEACGMTVTGQSRPGRGVGGDFFDLIKLDDDRVVVALGDVTGKGISAGVLMTATQGYLNAILDETIQSPEALAKAVGRLSGFVNPRCPANRFVTLWVGLFDRSQNTLTYVDAGHGLTVLRRAESKSFQPEGVGGMPVGVLDGATYEAAVVEFSPGDACLVVSDGIVEQPAAGSVGRDRDEFGIERTSRVFDDARGQNGDHLVTALYAAVEAHAGSTQLADDATIVVVEPT